MLISYRWLARHVDLTGIDPETLANDLTLSTAEVEGVEAFAPLLPGLGIELGGAALFGLGADLVGKRGDAHVVLGEHGTRRGMLGGADDLVAARLAASGGLQQIAPNK